MGGGIINDLYKTRNVLSISNIHFWSSLIRFTSDILGTVDVMYCGFVSLTLNGKRELICRQHVTYQEQKIASTLYLRPSLEDGETGHSLGGLGGEFNVGAPPAP